MTLYTDQLSHNDKLEINKVEKIEERLCYDAHWDIHSNLGVIRIKIYDGWRENDLLNECKKFSTVKDLINFLPKYFYYD